MSSKPKQTQQQIELEKLSIERERQLRVENARQTTSAFSDNLAFRRKLRGIFSLLSGGFKGFPAGSSSTSSGSSSGGGASLSGSGGVPAGGPSNGGGGRSPGVGSNR
ncbi:MAG: hypothetical protein E4G91_08315 [Candidatus Zixiibacteriota bacterium]|nr:MAG: hypothetical protein E4G91_08315 [candidate division Zixibacteria bacterium]